MNYVDEDEQYIKALCGNCQRVIKMKKENCIQTATGYSLIQPAKCVCNNPFDAILGTKETKAARDKLRYDIDQWGQRSPNIVCPLCQNKGNVHVKPVKRKKGISGGKVMGGLLTVGVSLFATGLARKEQLTQAHCTKCNSTWDF